jgi:Ti-type conjugative transfer relaxase TraA
MLTARATYRAMLSVGKLAAGPGAGRYYEDAIALGREDYYAGEGERPGRWLGAGSELLGLSGEVVEGQAGHLLSGEDPSSGELLGRPLGEGSVAGFDLTFNAPKSVGLAFAIGDPWTARVLRECHERAVDDALTYLEQHACRARRGKDGVLVIDGKGFAAAAFDHRTSRAGDPQLHTHVVVSNRTLGEDGRWTALDARPLYQHAKTAGYLYQARLRHEVTDRLGARWGPVKKGAADLHGFSRKLIEHFSQRRAEILEQLELHGSHSLAAGNAAALETRKRKDLSTPFARLKEEWRARAAEHGLTRERIEELLTKRFREPATPDEIDLLTLTEKSATFTRRDVLQALCEAHPDGIASIADIELQADQILARDELVRIPDPAGTRYTTRAQIDLEEGLLDGVGKRRDSEVSIVSPDEAEQAIKKRRTLSDEQAQAVRALTRSGHGVEVLRAPAGAGKTFALDAAREAWQASGRQVIGCALSAQAARELREQGGIETETIAKLKQRIERGHQLEPDSVLIVDEAGMVGVRDLKHLVDFAEQSGAKLLLVGDDRQLPEIEAGGGFRAIAERHGAVELSEVRRQDRDWDRRALNSLREGRTVDWADAYVDHGRVETAATAPALRNKLTRDWWDATQAGADARMIALRRADVADLNQRGRQQMRDAGRLEGHDVQIGDRLFAKGDEIVIGRNDKHLGVINGDRAEVLNLTDEHLDIKTDKGDEIRLPRTFIEDGHVDHGYATTAHKAQGATFDKAFVLGSQEAYREWGYTGLPPLR